MFHPYAEVTIAAFELYVKTSYRGRGPKLDCNIFWIEFRYPVATSLSRLNK